MGVSSMLPTIKSLGIPMLFLKVFGVLRTFLQKGSKPPEAVPPFPYKLQFLYSKISNNSGRLSTVTSGISPSWWMVSWPP